MLNNGALVNMIHMYINTGYIPSKTNYLYPVFIEWKKKWNSKGYYGKKTS